MTTYKINILICFEMLIFSNFLLLLVSLIRLQRPKLGSLAHMLISNTKRNKITIILPFIVSHKLCMYMSMLCFCFLNSYPIKIPSRNKLHSAFMHDIFWLKYEIYFIIDMIVCRLWYKNYSSYYSILYHDNSRNRTAKILLIRTKIILYLYSY